MPGVTTPVNAIKLQAALKGYDNNLASYLVHGFTYGFDIHSSLVGDPDKNGYSNHKSAIVNSKTFEDKLQKEIALGRMSGPYNLPPFPDMTFSPLGLVPKREPGQFRTIFDLSFPCNNSVNSHIEKEHSHVVYETLDNCITIIQSIGEGCLVAKADIKDAFRIIPINPDFHRLLGFTWDGQIYFDKCLPMGLSESCQIFETLSCALQWVLERQFHVRYVSHILDDFIIFGNPQSNECHRGLQAFLHLAAFINISIKHKKTVEPSTVVQLHGVEVDTDLMEVRLPKDKLQELIPLVASCAKKKKLSVRALQSLVGKLNFACRVVVPGRAFLRRLHNLLRGRTKNHHLIRINKEARADLLVWSQFLKHFNGKSLFLPRTWLSSNSIKMSSDACAKGFAAVYGGRWLQGSFPSQWASVHITIKELLPIVIAMKLWGPGLANRRILFLTDNIAVVFIINNQSSKDSVIMTLVRSLVVTLLTHNIELRAKHIPGKENTLADLLSRFQMKAAQRLAPYLREHPERIKQEWLPW